MLAHPDTLENFAGLPAALAMRHARCDQRDRRVLGGIQRRQKVVLLEDEADGLAPKCDLLGVRQP